MLTWQTARLLELEAARAGHFVQVRPELVVEIAFDGAQTSPRCSGGVALRFAVCCDTARTRPRAGPTRSRRCRPCARA